MNRGSVYSPNAGEGVFSEFHGSKRSRRLTSKRPSRAYVTLREIEMRRLSIMRYTTM